MASAMALLLTGALSATAVALPVEGQSSAPRGKTGAPTRYHRNHIPQRGQSYYGLVWGVDSLSVKAVESGALIRFSYRILDPEKAKVLNDKKVEAYLEVPARNLKLSIPSLEKVGQLRQGSAEESGRAYWMAFSNPRRTVKSGDLVNIVIGNFHAEGLILE